MQPRKVQGWESLGIKIHQWVQESKGKREKEKARERELPGLFCAPRGAKG